MTADFHFLRPLWLLALVPVIVLCILLWQKKKHSSAWQGIIDSQLLKYLIEGQVSTAFRWQIIALFFAWIVTSIALAGPSWQRLPLPVHQPEAAVVILLDLSPSMMAEDIKPSRLVRTRYKVTDFLNARNEGVTALIAYAGESYVVSPLTDDINTITNLLPALEPGIMPLAGSNIEMAIDMALQMFTDAGISRGEIVAVTDGIHPSAFTDIKEKLDGQAFRFSVMGVGSPEGAPIPTGNGGFAKDSDRNIVVAKLNRNELMQLSAELGGVYTDLRPDEKDVQALLASSQQLDPLDQQRLLEREFDTWLDQGQWLALIILPFVALAFRKGWLITLMFVFMFQPKPVYAFEWRDLWMRSDQQGQALLSEGDAENAAETFKSPEWKGTANYRAENYEAAAESFSEGQTARDHFNRGNALAKARKLEEAIDAYDQALQQQPGFEDAQFNSELVKNLLEQQKQQQSQQGDPNSEQEEGEQGEESDQQQAQDQQDQQNSEQSEGEQQEQQQAQSQDSQDAESEQQSSQNNNQQIDEQGAQELADREQRGEQLSEEEQQALEQYRERTEQQQQDPNQDGSEQQLMAENNNQEEEQQQALEQWLRQVPDDPSGLMRRKFEFQHRKMLQDYRSGRWEPPENRAYERW